MEKFFLFLILLFLVFTAGFFFDAAFHFWGMLTNLVLFWFFVFVSFRLKPHEIFFVGALIGILRGFLAAGTVWFWFFIFIVVSFVMMAAHFLVNASGRFQFFFFSVAGWAGMLLLRMLWLFFAGAGQAGYGAVLDYVVSPLFGWEIVLSAVLLFCIGAVAYFFGRLERTYYV
ncbi:hypothetical protein KGQ34_01280 [Patescibacteria group bacterium]|nr:hypothetical protein [Patescibacteria group bacterium]